MKPRFDDPTAREEVRRRLAGMGERSSRKSYYPALQERLAELQRFRALLDGGSEAILLAALPGGALVDVNESACRQLRRGRAELLGAPLAAIAVEAERARVAAALERRARGEAPETVTTRLARGDGTAFSAEVTLSGKEVEGRGFVVAVARDVTEREQLQARLAVADRMVALGTLSAGVAHEINNPLTWVLASVDHLEQKLAQLRSGIEEALAGGPAARTGLLSLVAEADEAAADIRDGAARVREISRQLKGFARADSGASAVVDAEEVLEQALVVAAHELKRRARVVRSYAGKLRVVAARGRLAQVFLNLLVNAAQAIPDGDPAGHEVRVATRLDGDAVEVAVTDSGVGIAPEHLERLFQPFFTTKPEGVGTGLGLAISLEIVRSLGGEIRVESELGRGTTFRVRLPAAPPG